MEDSLQHKHYYESKTTEETYEVAGVSCPGGLISVAAPPMREESMSDVRGSWFN